MTARAIPLRDRFLADGRLPAICAPLVARTHDELVAEAARVAAKGPDLLEWRVDFFRDIGDTAAVLAALAAIRRAAGAVPLLFTRRSRFEGGEPIALDEPQVVALYRAVCESGLADLVDFEMSRDAAHVAEVRESARRHGAGLVLSFHDFARTPPADELHARFLQAQQLHADVAKIAVMPAGPDDVLTLLAATQRASRELGIPVITMSMGGWGALTRTAGWVFGSALTFAVGSTASAPGQMPIDDVRAAVAQLRAAMGPALSGR